MSDNECAHVVTRFPYRALGATSGLLGLWDEKRANPYHEVGPWFYRSMR